MRKEGKYIWKHGVDLTKYVSLLILKKRCKPVFTITKDKNSWYYLHSHIIGIYSLKKIISQLNYFGRNTVELFFDFLKTIIKISEACFYYCKVGLTVL